MIHFFKGKAMQKKYPLFKTMLLSISRINLWMIPKTHISPLSRKRVGEEEKEKERNGRSSIHTKFQASESP